MFTTESHTHSEWLPQESNLNIKCALTKAILQTLQFYKH